MDVRRKKDGLITLHRDNLNELFIIKYGRLCLCIPLLPQVRFSLFIFCNLVGLFLLLVTSPLTGLYRDNALPFLAVYFVAKILLYCSLLFIANPWKQIILICRPVRFCSTAFYCVGMVGVYCTIFELNTSIVLLLCSVLVQAVSFSFYSLSYLSFTHNVLFDCIKSNKFNYRRNNLKKKVPVQMREEGDVMIDLDQ